MASPQTENGYLRLANELAEALMKAPLNGSQWRVVMGVIRESYGWDRKLAPLSLRRLAAMTGMDRRNVRREVATLVTAGVIVRQDQDGEGTMLGIGKDYESWKLDRGRGSIHPLGSVGDRGRGSINDREVVASSPPYKRKKERLKKVRAEKQPADPRHQPIRKHYLERTKEKTETAPWNGGDGSALNAILEQNPEATEKTIIRWLDNAFDSELKVYLPDGFRFTQFGKYYPQYTRGPLLKGDHKGNGTGSKEGSLTQEELVLIAKGKHERQPATA